MNAGVRTSDELEFWIDGRQGTGVKFLASTFSIGRDGTNGENVVVASPGDAATGAMYELRVSGDIC